MPKGGFNKDILLQICCMFLEHLFLRTPLEGQHCLSTIRFWFSIVKFDMLQMFSLLWQSVLEILQFLWKTAMQKWSFCPPDKRLQGLSIVHKSRKVLNLRVYQKQYLRIYGINPYSRIFYKVFVTNNAILSPSIFMQNFVIFLKE